LTFNYDIRGSENESEKDEKARDEELVNINASVSVFFRWATREGFLYF